MSILKEKAMHSEITEFQTKTWGVRARDWSEYQEIQSKPLYEAILNKTNTKTNTTLLDVACGTGLLCQLASNRGARVSGFEASEPMLKIANERVPNGSFILGDISNLPYEDFSFDVVTVLNTIQTITNAKEALKECSRVTKRGGKIVLSTFGTQQECQTYEYIKALMSLITTPNKMDPFSLSTKGALEKLAESAGLTVLSSDTVDCPFTYNNEETMMKALLSPGLAEMAIENVGLNKVKETIQKAVSTHKTTTKGYHIPNKFHYIITTK